MLPELLRGMSKPPGRQAAKAAGSPLHKSRPGPARFARQGQNDLKLWQYSVLAIKKPWRSLAVPTNIS
jgi:hypothetical protein